MALVFKPVLFSSWFFGFSVFLVLIEPLVQILDQFFKLAQYHELANTGSNLSSGILGLVQFSRGVMSGIFSLSQIS
jgi:hypothetical protein